MMLRKLLASLPSLVIAGTLATPSEPAFANEGEAAFAARCGGCHEAGDIRAWGRKRPDAAAREAWLMSFLSKHHAPVDAQRELIVTHIQSTIAKASTPK